MCPFISVPSSGSRAFNIPRAATACRRWSGLASRLLNVSSRKFTPMPCVPPTSSSVSILHGLLRIISANNDSLTETTLPSDAKPFAISCTNSRSGSVSLLSCAGSLPNACPNFVRTFAACSTSNRSTVAKFWPSTIRMSRARIKREAAIAKSSRTMTIACKFPPSQCRNAAINSASDSARCACSHCSNWSIMMTTLWP